MPYTARGGSFTSGVVNNGGISATSLSTPVDITADANGVYIADYQNTRVLYYAGTSTTATRVYGQNGSFTTGTCIAASATTMCRPSGLALDAGGLYVSENTDNRAQYYSGTSTTGTRVYGQGGSFTALFANTPALNADALFYPYGMATDSSGVYIVDGNNHRVLYYAGTSTTATRVYGQAGSFTTGTANNPALNASSLKNPSGIAVDSTGVYIVDGGNNRVLYYSGVSTTATRVYGQGGSFTLGTANNGGISADSLSGPVKMAVDTSGIYIADAGNNRVLYYSGISTTASRVYGQNGSFTQSTANFGGISATSLNNPGCVFVNATGLYICDGGNNRVLVY